jgi:phage tail sheath protein FI
VLEQESRLVRLAAPAPVTRPAATPDAAPGVDPMTVTPGSIAFNADGDDGATISDSEVSAPALETGKRGIWALEKADLFNLLCIPPFSFEATGDIGAQTRTAAANYCRTRRALYIVDPLTAWDEPSDLIAGANSLDGATWGLARSENAAVYFPRLRSPDPLQEGRLAEFAPCGAIAGVFSRTDSQRGVWKAPAGMDAVLNGVSELTVKLTDGENGQLNPLGVNCLRVFPVTGRVVWGARTMRGADSLASEWKYVPVRRIALFIEESLYRGTQWVVFEPNDEPLWAQIRLNLGAFMQNLFRQGAFQGSSPREAYFVKCDRETTTQNDINLGIVNIIVGFAPLKPAEFVVIKLQQIAGQIET